ncbi:hypothetical protein B0H17DRAFT_1082455 [Mycena rosella]|uniref:Uncharacterized protein n=1 Tax=Mycena rosella TaxID=1033263 RepID=A0AAD7D1T1_MYCRO|nr:hypothetical protein B0H17DRAFT_1082455 [Mycena rosella]
MASLLAMDGERKFSGCPCCGGWPMPGWPLSPACCCMRWAKLSGPLGGCWPCELSWPFCGCWLCARLISSSCLWAAELFGCCWKACSIAVRLLRACSEGFDMPMFWKPGCDWDGCCC